MIQTATHSVEKNVNVILGGIPVRNLWHMLVYAWNELHVKDHWKADVDDAPSLDALLATILGKLIQQRLRIGLGRDYRTDEALISGVRGRVDFAGSLKRLAFQHGRAYCRFPTYSPNVPKNKIVRSTLARLSQVGEFGPVKSKAESLRHSLRCLVRDLHMVDLVELKPAFVRLQQLKRNDADYRLMLAICHLVLQRQMPTESAGTDNLTDLDRDALTLWRVFESFVANFYRINLAGWTVMSQTTLQWHETKTSQYLPVMNPDIVLRNDASGTLVVLDTKFYKQTLTSGRWGNETFNRDHLFQIYAYLRSQEHVSTHHRCATGILLYPTVQQSLSETVELQGHLIRWETIDLSLPWQIIETNLLNLITAPHSGLAHDPVDTQQ